MPLAARSSPVPVALATAILLLAASAHAVDVKFQPVADGVYAHIGDTGPRSLDNEGLNANVGLVVTPAGAVLIDSGATYRSARQIHEAVRKVTAQPVKWVINTGGQDHRWLGNGYFKEQGAEVIAHVEARADMQARGGDHLAGLKATLQDRADGTVATLPTRFVSGNVSSLELGGVVFRLEHRNGAHTPGDTMVWLPQKNVLFAGDVVYVDRLLGVIAVSNTC
jgi:glyoxylase-like metal-dependent hydrolase (beta-lactamase superfamily II)